nr:translational initiation factor 1 [Clematis tomentella]
MNHFPMVCFGFVVTFQHSSRSDTIGGSKFQETYFLFFEGVDSKLK